MKKIIWNLLNNKNSVKNAGYLQRYMAFTIAELLIVVGVIGIIAESTIPVLITNAEKSEYYAYSRKMQSVLYSTFTSLKDDNGGVSFLANYATSSDFIDALSTKIGYIEKINDSATAATQCWTDATKSTRAPASSFTAQACLKLKDGSFLTIVTVSGPVSRVCPDWSTSTCYALLADINGLKGPNVFLQDVVVFGMSNNNLFTNVTLGPTLSTKINGVSIPLNGSKMNGDY